MKFCFKRERALICGALSLLMVVSCRVQNEPSPAENKANDTTVSTTPPFQTREPDRYRATRAITNVTVDGRTMITTSSTFRDGELRRHEIELSSKQLVLLDTPMGQFVLFPEEKVYAEKTDKDAATGDDSEENSPDKLLHTDSVNSTYQKLGTELIAGRNTNKYRVVVNGSTATNVSQSETLIWIDEALGMPIRSETKSGDGSQTRMELSQIALDVDQNVFKIPDDYRKIPLNELLGRLNGRN